MYNKVSSGNTPPADANLAHQALGPEQIELNAKFTGLVDDVLAHYEQQKPEYTNPVPDPVVPRSTVTGYDYRDGTERHVTHDGNDGTVTTKVYMPEAVTDPEGRRVLFITKQGSDGSKVYDMRFLSKKVSTIYRWSASEPVSEIRGNISEPLAADTQQYQRGSVFVDYVRHE